MPAARLWNRIVRYHEQHREEAETEYKKWIIGQLNVTRAITYALQANQDLPEDPSRSKKKPNVSEIKKAREEMIAFMERHQKAISHPYLFEEYMGFATPERGHFFDPPTEEFMRQMDPKERVKIQKEEARARESRMIDKLQALVDSGKGDTPLGEL